MPDLTHITMETLMFIPDSTVPFHWESAYLCLIASPWPGWKSRWYCHRNPLFIPDRTFRENVDFQLPKATKNRGKSMAFSTHSSGLTLGNSLGAFWHKQDSLTMKLYKLAAIQFQNLLFQLSSKLLKADRWVWIKLLRHRHFRISFQPRQRLHFPP